MISKNQIKFIRQLEQKKYRRQERLFVAEGVKVVDDLLGCSLPHSLFATHDYLISRPSLLQAVFNVVEVTDDELQRISFQQHPQQVLALFPLPENGIKEMKSEDLALALDGIQDPGNLGTIIRIADWFGIDTIICSEDTVDAWNPKVVQATMGSIARVNVAYTDLLALLNTLPKDFPVYATILNGKNIYQQQLSANGLIIMGNEGNGISDAIRQKANRPLFIPSFHQGVTADSLNVAIATAITCSEFRRRQ